MLRYRLFLVEGIITVIFGFSLIFLLPDCKAFFEKCQIGLT